VPGLLLKSRGGTIWGHPYEQRVRGEPCARGAKMTGPSGVTQEVLSVEQRPERNPWGGGAEAPHRVMGRGTRGARAAAVEWAWSGRGGAWPARADQTGGAGGPRGESFGVWGSRS